MLTLLLAPLMGYAQYALKKEKEFHIDSLYPVELVDYHPGEGLYLGYVEMKSKGVEVVLVNEEGEIVVQKKLAGEGPEQYTASLNCLAFSDEGEVLLQTPFEVLRYDRGLRDWSLCDGKDGAEVSPGGAGGGGLLGGVDEHQSAAMGMQSRRYTKVHIFAPLLFSLTILDEEKRLKDRNYSLSFSPILKSLK